MNTLENIEKLKKDIFALEEELEIARYIDTYGSQKVIQKIENEIKENQKNIDFINLLLKSLDKHH